MLTTPAFAADAAATASGDMFTSLLPVILILVVFYFLVIRPQNKRMQDHRNMINSLQKGDKVVTGGGLIGTVKKVTEGSDEIELELGAGVTVTAVRSTIISVREKKSA